jgi:sulfur relay protein TusB/DsrH
LNIQDACLAASSSEHCEKLLKNRIQIYALKSDLQARGLLKKVNKRAKIIDYKQWVELVMVEHDHVVSWTS